MFRTLIAKEQKASFSPDQVVVPKKDKRVREGVGLQRFSLSMPARCTYPHRHVTLKVAAPPFTHPIPFHLMPLRERERARALVCADTHGHPPEAGLGVSRPAKRPAPTAATPPHFSFHLSSRPLVFPNANPPSSPPVRPPALPFA